MSLWDILRFVGRRRIRIDYSLVREQISGCEIDIGELFSLCSRMRPRLYNVLRNQIDGSIVGYHIDAIENGLVYTRKRRVDFRVRVRINELERTWLAVGNVEAIKL